MHRSSRIVPPADGTRFYRVINAIAAIAVLALTQSGCRKTATEPVTLSYFRLGWSQPDEPATAEPLSQKFIQETGIHLKSLPVPEDTADQLDLSRKLLEAGSGADVLGVDLIWAGVLGEDLADLGAPLKKETSLLEPDLLRSYTADGRLVAIPVTVQIGVLEYRTDLLRAYGYDHPPRTWDELEKMALRIQTGERAKGRKDFWGYVWQGADAEALTCNALEWQFSEGGGRIIEEDHSVSVNNAAAIRSWQRAKRWIGRISPPSVVAFHELDSMNIFDSGAAAFNRVWGAANIARNGLYRQLHWRASLAEGKTGYASIPGGPGGWAGTLGGSGLAVSRLSPHPKEATELVRFLIRKEIQSESTKDTAPPNTLNAYNRPTKGTNNVEGSGQRPGVVTRPSSETGRAYEQVSRAYVRAVHSVLTGETGAPEAAAELEKELVKITGFRTGPPRKQ
jgi:trehalose/maltose transport system substrate-binding protein